MGVPGKYISAARHLLGLNQRELAQLAQVHTNSIKRVEHEKYAAGYAAGRAVEALSDKGIEIRPGIIIQHDRPAA